MKGVIIAAGLGTRLRPTTKVVDKNLFLIYDKPMIYYSILTLKQVGITNILVISNPKYAGGMLGLLASGRELGVKLTYDIQEEPKGIAHALAVAEDFADSERIAVIFPDNIFGASKDLKKAVSDFETQEKGAKIALVQVSDPGRFGVPKFAKKSGTIAEIVEKPKRPWTNWIIPGFYLYDNRVFGFIRTLKPSARGEYEITDLNNIYVKEKTMTYQKVRGFWKDAGTFDSLLEASVFMAKKARLCGKKNS